MIVTDRLTLRAPEPQDAAFITTALSDFDVTKWLAEVPFPYEHAMAKDWLSFPSTSWPDVAIVIHEGRGIGCVDTKGGSIGYWLAREAWGHGFMTEAAGAMRDAYFNRTAADEMRSGYFAGNAGSSGVLRKLGFTATSESMLNNTAQGCALPHINMKLTRADWEARA